jgi:hypothetical protein
MTSNPGGNGISSNRTVQPGIVRFHVGFLHLSLLDDQGVALAAMIPKQSRAIESQIQRLGKFTCRVT